MLSKMNKMILLKLILLISMLSNIILQAKIRMKLSKITLTEKMKN